MSSLRFNGKELLSYAATTTDAVVKGPVKKVSKKSRSNHLWIVIKCNLLFIFKSQSEPTPGDCAHSCYILEVCYPDVTDIGFKVVFNDSLRTSFLSFICPSEQAKIWVQSIREANFRYLRNCLVYYKSILSTLQIDGNECCNDTANYSSIPKRVAMVLQLQGLQLQLIECHIQVQVISEAGKCVLRTSSKAYNCNTIQFHETLFLELCSYSDVFRVCVMRTSSAAKQPCYVNIFTSEFCPIRIIHGQKVSESIFQIDNASACGILTIRFLDIDGALVSVTRQSNHRSSCLFTETIQPLPLEEKDGLFNSIFSTLLENNYVINPMSSISGSPVNLLHESLLKLNRNSSITINYLEFLNRSDSDLLRLIKNYIGNDNAVGNIKNLEFRIDINQQHKKYLEDAFGATKHHKSLKRSGYQALYFPSNLISYRAKIMDSSFEHYEIFEKTILSTPTKNTDSLKEGGLYSMLCDPHIKTSFHMCKRFTQYKDKMTLYTDQLNSNLARIATSLANYNLDEFTRSFKDYEAISHSMISLCANAEVADLVIELAIILGESSKSPLYVWLKDRILYIDHSWSIASNLRDLISQIQQLADICLELVNDYRSDLWVEMLFLPCNKFQRDLQSLVEVSKAALDYKVHCIQNVSSVMNRFIMRSDAVVAQLLLAVITTIYSSIYVYMDDVFFWLQLLNIGFFVQIESLISCRGIERVLLEDVYVASELLKNCKIEITCKDESQTLPHFSGSRYNILISVPVSTRIYALLLDVCQGYCNRKLNLLPVLCNQIINKTEIALLTETERRFIQRINSNSIDYVRKVLDSNRIFYQSIEDSEKTGLIYEHLNKLRDLYLLPGEPSEILPLFQTLGKLLCAGQIVTCPNGIDYSAMTVTFSLVHHLKSSYNLDNDNTSFSEVLKSIRQGAFLSRAGKNRSYDHYTLASQMFPEYYL